MTKPYNQENGTSVQSKARKDELTPQQRGKRVYNTIKRVAWPLIKQLPKDEQLKTAEYLGKSFSKWAELNGEYSPAETTTNYREHGFVDMEVDRWKELRLISDLPIEDDIVSDYDVPMFTRAMALTDFCLLF